MPAPQPLSVTIYMHDLSGGGVERQTLALARQLKMIGLTVTLLLHQAHGELRETVSSDLRVVDLHSRRTLQDIRLIARFLRQEQPDVLIANLDHNNVAAALGNLLAGIKTKLIICQHNSMSAAHFHGERWTYRFIPMMYRLLSPCIGRAVAVSNGVGRELHTLAHFPERKLTVIHNPVIGPDFEYRAAQPAAHPWFDQPETPVFVTAGRLVALKDQETLLRALAIHRRHCPSRLLVLGTGPLRDSLLALTSELGLRDAVDFLGFVENPLPYFRCSDAFVLSSYSEGFGNVLVEAMGCGTPVIATDCEYGPAEILDHGRYGVLVPPRNAQEMARAMDRVADLRRQWPPVMLKARAEEFTEAACAAAYLRLFHSLVPMKTMAR
jgi:glycosyltransferase involved in cell wall biosynthesis